MAHVTLKEILSQSVEGKYAVGAFPGMDYSITEAILSACEKKNVPVIFLLWGGYVFGKKNNEKVWFENMWNMLDRASVPVAMILDHGSYEECYYAMELGFKSIMFDGSSLPLEENIKKTAEIVKEAHKRGISVEGEVGHVGGDEGVTEGGEVKRDLFTKPEDARRFVEETGVDALAVAVGSKHGVYETDPNLDLVRLDEIRAAVGDVPLVMHGGSGIKDDMMRQAVDHGINKINYVTYLMLAAEEASDEKRESGKRLTYWDMVQVANKRIEQEIAHEVEVFNTKELVL